MRQGSSRQLPGGAQKLASEATVGYQTKVVGGVVTRTPIAVSYVHIIRLIFTSRDACDSIPVVMLS